MIIIGIDPGVSGAISVLDDKQVINVYDMPVMIDGKKNKKQVNGAQLTFLLREKINLKKEIVVVVEHVTAMPGQGVTSMFNFGQSLGVIKGVCAALELPIYLIRPMKWKKHFDLLKTNKDASRTKVIQIYPSLSPQLSKKKDSNKADAILIGLYFYDQKNNKS